MSNISIYDSCVLGRIQHFNVSKNAKARKRKRRRELTFAVKDCGGKGFQENEKRAVKTNAASGNARLRWGWAKSS